MSAKIVFTPSRSFGIEPFEFGAIMDTVRSARLIRVASSALRHPDHNHWRRILRVQVRSSASERGEFGRYFGPFTSRQEAYSGSDRINDKLRCQLVGGVRQHAG